ncbi:hypothetical protein AAMO2058_001517400 [Amorphochlora amoebiformis]
MAEYTTMSVERKSGGRVSATAVRCVVGCFVACILLAVLVARTTGDAHVDQSDVGSGIGVRGAGRSHAPVARRLLTPSVAGAIATALTNTKPAKAEMGQIITTPSGLQYYDVVEGTGAAPKPGQLVKVHYTGWLQGFDQPANKFDSSRDRGRPFSFNVGTGMVIKGWDEGVLGMRVGSRRRLIIPADLGYGQRGAGRIIPPGATLYFDVELLGIAF